MKVNEKLSGTLLTQGGKPDHCFPVRSFHSVVQTKSSDRVYTTCLAKPIDHESETDQHLSLRAKQNIETHDP
jgi:hypothetical protein